MANVVGLKPAVTIAVPLTVIVVQARIIAGRDVWQLLDVAIQLRLRMVLFLAGGREEIRRGRRKWNKV
jgi:hypothetical protein